MPTKNFGGFGRVNADSNADSTLNFIRKVKKIIHNHSSFALKILLQ